LITRNVDRLKLMADNFNWDGKYDLVIEQQFQTEKFIASSKSKLRLEQIGSDEDIAKYMCSHPDCYEKGMMLNDLKTLINIDDYLRLGHFLHDTYHGYPAEYYLFQVDCFDYCGSAAHFYNEAYDYYHRRKEIKNYRELDIAKIHYTEQKRIQSSDEVAYRNFREAFINLVFFVESFINSVGFHAYLDNAGKSPIEKNQLKGIQSIDKNGFNRYSNLRQRIENISKILGGESIDTKQEPFRSYLESSVELRNQYVHSSPDKGKIYFSLNDWKTKCDEMIDKVCLEVMETFWNSCYPQKQFPIIIFNEFCGNSFKGRAGKFYAHPKS